MNKSTKTVTEKYCLDWEDTWNGSGFKAMFPDFANQRHFSMHDGAGYSAGNTAGWHATNGENKTSLFFRTVKLHTHKLDTIKDETFWRNWLKKKLTRWSILPSSVRKKMVTMMDQKWLSLQFVKYANYKKITDMYFVWDSSKDVIHLHLKIPDLWMGGVSMA